MRYVSLGRLQLGDNLLPTFQHPSSPSNTPPPAHFQPFPFGRHSLENCSNSSPEFASENHSVAELTSSSGGRFFYTDETVVVQYENARRAGKNSPRVN